MLCKYHYYTCTCTVRKLIMNRSIINMLWLHYIIISINIILSTDANLLHKSFTTKVMHNDTTKLENYSISGIMTSTCSLDTLSTLQMTRLAMASTARSALSITGSLRLLHHTSKGFPNTKR